MRLKNKTALVTGAGRGIGKAIAIGFAREGANVIINDLEGSHYAEEVVATIQKLGRKSSVIYTDISDVGQIQKMFQKIDAEYGKLDILVNNAGLTGWSNFFDTTEEIFDKVIGVNLKGTLFCSIEAAKIMRKNSGGSIINISSICAALSVKNLITYSTSKGGIHAMSEQMAVELAPYNIRVNTFGPGPVNVERNLQEDPDYKTNWGNMIPLGRTAEPEEMIGPAIFLASDDSSYVSGQLFYVDGAWSVQGSVPINSMNSQLKNTGNKG